VVGSSVASRRRAAWLLQPHVLFATIATVFGLLYVVTTPPFMAPDEVRHLGRAYLISQGVLGLPHEGAGERAQLPRSILRLDRSAAGLWPMGLRANRYEPVLRGFWDVPLAPHDRARVPAPSSYSPLAYLPQALAIAVVRGFEPPAVLLLYVARLANLAACVATFAWAIRLAPLRRWAFFLLALMPMSLFQAASCSADAVTNAVALLFLVLVLRACSRTSPGELSDSTVTGLVGLSGLLGLMKPGYWPLAACTLLVPRVCYRDRHQWWALNVGVALAALVPSGAWLLAVRAADLAPLTASADPPAQLRFIAEHPIDFLVALVRGPIEHAHRIGMSFVGVLGYLDVGLPAPVYALYPAALLVSALGDGPDPPPWNAARRVFLVAIFLAASATMMAIAYVGWNAVGAPFVDGVQGRYFLPMAPLLLVALPAPSWPAAARAVAPVAIAVSVYASWCSVWALGVRYYAW
jgi:uncharacterized membrane protein